MCCTIYIPSKLMKYKQVMIISRIPQRSRSETSICDSENNNVFKFIFNVLTLFCLKESLRHICLQIV